jgi:CheY-like chemotaxis protein
MRMASDTATTRGGLRLLLVDDDGDSAELLGELLQRAGHQVEIATDPEAALATVVSFQPAVAIIDIGLPIMNGYELARKLRTLCPCKLIALSGYGRESAPPDTAVTTFDQHLLKPVDSAKLLEVIASLT